jgi:hypothetical protein
MMKKIDKKIRNDILLIAALLVVALAAYLIIQLGKTDGGYAVVVRDGEEIASYPLDKPTTVTFTSASGSSNTLVIQDGYADMTEADCPDKLCVHQNRIKFSGETIVCLPNKLVVKIVSDESGDVDFTA